jgi:phosphatidylserine/phosphatidylglycerophosphate/cardiolipin synthase-like enzyme
MIRFIKYSSIKFNKHKEKIFLGFCFFTLLALCLIYISYKFSMKINYEYNPKPKNEIALDHNFEGQLFFNDKDGSDEFKKIITESIISAKKSIDVAIYSIDDIEIISLLEEKKLQGLDINIIVPKSKQDSHKDVFKDTNLEIIQLTRNHFFEKIESLMHHKFIIIDKFEENQKIIFTSANLTKIQNDYDPNFLLLTKETEIIKTFVEEFELLKNRKTSIQKLRDKNFQPFSKKALFLNGFMEIWFSPGYRKNSVKTRVLDLINNAENSIEIIAWQLNDYEIFKALSKRAKEGINITIIADDYYLWSEYSIVKELFYLQKNINKNIKIISDSFTSIAIQDGYIKNNNQLIKEFNSFLHHHTMIIDKKILVMGTNNWGKNGFYNNDESIIVTDIKHLVDSYTNYLSYLLENIKASDIDFEKKDKEIIINNIVGENLKFIIYKEKSYPELTGIKCKESEIKENKITIDTTDKCIDEKSKIYIFDSNGKLISSDYLFE